MKHLGAKSKHAHTLYSRPGGRQRPPYRKPKHTRAHTFWALLHSELTSFAYPPQHLLGQASRLSTRNRRPPFGKAPALRLAPPPKSSRKGTQSTGPPLAHKCANVANATQQKREHLTSQSTGAVVAGGGCVAAPSARRPQRRPFHSKQAASDGDVRATRRRVALRAEALNSCAADATQPETATQARAGRRMQAPPRCRRKPQCRSPCCSALALRLEQTPRAWARSADHPALNSSPRAHSRAAGTSNAAQLELAIWSQQRKARRKARALAA